MGALASLVALALLADGTAVIVDHTQRDSAGFATTGTRTLPTHTYALVSLV
jgi:hypothetical protein